jgi:hypothetical protein
MLLCVLCAGLVRLGAAVVMVLPVIGGRLGLAVGLIIASLLFQLIVLLHGGDTLTGLSKSLDLHWDLLYV